MVHRRATHLFAILVMVLILSAWQQKPVEGAGMAQQQVINLLQNGDFESGISPWQGLSSGQVVAIDTPDGSQAIKITRDEASQGWINVKPGQNYVVTAWFKWVTLEGKDWGYDRVSVFSEDWSEVASLNSPHKKYEQGKWHKLALAFTATSPRIQVKFGMFGPQEQVELYFDGLQLFERTENFAPTLEVSADTTRGVAPLQVHFTANASDLDGAIEYYHWDFGDGSTAITQEPTHTFTDRGTHIVTMKVWDNDGLKAEKTTAITVEDPSAPDIHLNSRFSPSLLAAAAQPEARLRGWSLANDGAKIIRVVWDNVSTNETGILDIIPGQQVEWLTETLSLKAGANEILITATDDRGRISTKRVTVNRWTEGPAVSAISKIPTSVPVYEKFELTFQLDTSAENYFFRYDADPPDGIRPKIGVSADAVFTTPSGKTLRQPAFFTHRAERIPCGDQVCFQTGSESQWVVRFSPQEAGQYQVSLHVEDSSGTVDVPVGSFQTSQAKSKGFIQVSKKDSRYFEYSNGDLYWPLGPATGIQYDRYPDTGQNLERPWMAGTGAYSTNFARWMSSGLSLGNEGYDSQLTYEEHYPSHQLSQVLRYPDATRLWIGWLNGQEYRPLLKPDTEYQIKLRLKTSGIAGPVDPAYPYGLMIKKHGWPSETFEADNREKPSMIPPVTQNTGWHTIVSRYKANENDANNDRNPYITLYLDNVSAGEVFIDQFSMREVLSDGSLGGELIVSSAADLHTYVDDGPAAAIDWQVQQGEQYGVTFKYVVQDKRDWVAGHLVKAGIFTDNGSGYYQPDGTAARWLQQQWWRYLIARWGYSTAIHSWELNNEGPPQETAHYQLAQDFARFMHQNDPHPHLVTTSFWSGWWPEFWGDSQKYPDVDYADIHEYIKDKNAAYDLVQWQIDTAKTIYEAGVPKPVMRGETGIGGPSDDFFARLKEPNDGIWYHNLLWSQLHSQVLYNPNYWWSEHLKLIDKEAISKAFYRFASDLDLNQGGYVDISARTGNPSLRVLGQKNMTSGRAHLWVQNRMHTWRNAAQFDGAQPITPQSGTVSFVLSPQASYQVEYWDTYTGQVVSQETLTAATDGSLTLAVKDLSTDLAVKIQPAQP